MKSIQTPRTIIREIQPADAPFILELMNSPAWLKNIGDRNIKSLRKAEEYTHQNLISNYKKFGFGMWLVIKKDAQTPIGICGLLQRDYLSIPDIGFAFLPAYIGKGYGQESAEAVIEHADKYLNLTKIAAFTDPKNDTSIRLLMKLGFKEQQPMKLPNESEVSYFERNI